MRTHQARCNTALKARDIMQTRVTKLYCGIDTTGDPWAPDPACYLTDEEIS